MPPLALGLLALLFLVLNGCEPPASTDVDLDLFFSLEGATMEIVSGDGETVEPGESLWAEVLLRGNRNQAVRRATVVWEVTSGGGSVSSSESKTVGNGRARVRWTTGPQPGNQTLEARAPGIGSVTFTVNVVGDDEDTPDNPEAKGTLTLSPGNIRLTAIGDAAQLEVEATDAGGASIENPGVTWTSSDPAVATVNEEGRVLAMAAGTAYIVVAASCCLPDTVAVEVVRDREAQGEGIWISQDELARLPTSGAAWDNMRKAADTDLRGGVITERDSHNARVMAAALVAARLNHDGYRARVRDALVDLMNARLDTQDGLARNRRLGSYAIAADLIDLSTFDSRVDARFRDWLELIRSTTFQSGGGGTLAGYHERRPNNYGTHAGASRMAVALYLGDRADFERALVVFKGYLGDRSSYAGFQYRVDWSWHLDEGRPRGINPKGATKNGRNVDGVMPDDQRRCGTIYDTPWPCTTGYSWEGLQGVVAMAWIAHRQGHPAFEWEDQAILRANVWLYQVNGHPAVGDDTWQPHVINHIYGTSFPAPVPSRHGKNVGWTDWTHR